MGQSNGVLRAKDFDAMLRRHPGERGICIDHWVCLLARFFFFFGVPIVNSSTKQRNWQSWYRDARTGTVALVRCCGLPGTALRTLVLTCQYGATGTALRTLVLTRGCGATRLRS